jgi:hypothetical protein
MEGSGKSMLTSCLVMNWSGKMHSVFEASGFGMQSPLAQTLPGSHIVPSIKALKIGY